MCEKRRARDSNPQPVARHLNSNQGTTLEIPEQLNDSDNCAAPGAAAEYENHSFECIATNGRAGQGCGLQAIDDARLQEVVRRWSKLAEPVRLAVLALVRTPD